MRPYLFRLFILHLLLAGFVTRAQTVGNEWINYNQTYYKIKTGKEGIYRVAVSALTGLPSTVNGSNLVLYRDGQEMPLYVSANGPLGTGDYIEFHGRRADGRLDKELYENPAWHPDDRISLFSDTAVYFLTYDNQSNHQRFVQTPNTIPATPPPPVPYCMVTTGNYYLGEFNSGRNMVQPYHIPASLFDNGEGYVDTMMHASVPLTYILNAPNAVNAPVSARVQSSVLRSTTGPFVNQLRILLNSQQIADSTVQPDATKQFSLQVPASQIAATNSFQFLMANGSNAGDYYGVSFIEIEYPRDFDFGNAGYLRFKLAASSASQYLEISNPGSGASPARLYDLTNRKWYAGDMSVAGKARYYIDPSFTERELVFYTSSSPEIINVVATETRNFRNFQDAANQGNYVILSHDNYDATVNGRNYISEYRDYRASAAGGAYTPVIVDVRELYDQFGYGQDIHPLAIRRFFKYAYDTWQTKPGTVFVIGKGLLYHKYRTYLQNPSLYPYAAIVPTYGDLGSDINFVNFLPNRLQAINIGRFSAWTPQEVGNYLDKVKTLESALKQGPAPSHETELWKKTVLHIGGGNSVGQQNYLLETLSLAGDIIKDTSFGAEVHTITKNTTNPIDVVNKNIDSLINNGVSLISFNGHATANGFDLSLNNPESYNSAPRFPHFIALGCDVAQIFSLTNSQRTYSERFLLAPSGGSISMIASNNLQFETFHRPYLPTVYNSISRLNYGGTIGDHHRYAYDSMRKANQSDMTYYQIESLILQGDPAIPVFGLPKPDYHVAANRLSAIPANVTTSMDSFTLRVVAFNLAKAINDTVRVKVEHINPAGVTTVLNTVSLTRLYRSDTFQLNVGINKVVDIGLNKYRVIIDADNKFDETNEGNNMATLDVFIYSDNLVPVHPKEFSIVTTQPVTLKASTLNAFRGMGRYRLQIDTTELFNSPLKQETTVSSRGGVIDWTPSISLTDSTVYYWRTTFDSSVNGDFQWSYSSFVYLPNGSPGWNQSHHYQYLKNTFNGLSYGNDRTFKYPIGFNQLTASNAIYSDLIPNWPWNTADFVKVVLNGFDVQRLGCFPWDGTLQINVFDSVTNALWKNDSLSGTSGAYPSCLGTRDLYTFEFPINTPQGRANAADFLDSIPDGNFVLIRNIINLGKYDTAFVDEWKTDPGQPLYQEMLDLGFDQIDSFNKIRPFVFFRKKGSTNYPVYQYMGADWMDTLVKTFMLPTLKPRGVMNSTVIGPAKAWQELKWAYTSDANPLNDRPFVAVYGITPNQVSTLLYQGYARDTTLSFIDASQYPNLKLVWTSYDSVDLTSPQLRYWRVLYSPVPEAALNSAKHFVFKDSIQAGETFNFSVAVENLTEIPMDSMLVRYKLIDANNNTHLLGDKRYRNLTGFDTLHASFGFDPRSYGGNNIFFIEANPDNDQPEQYHPNNLGYLPFKVEVDQRNPLIDVTFDGVHILDRDIVSSRPFIKIALRDENKFLKLDDTSLLKLRIRFPSDVGSSREVPFDGTITRFIPAQPGDKNNEAIIEYRPTLPEDGIYELFVNGSDRTGNEAGPNDYQISFEVVNKSTITNVLNYPNPFSTSTAFVFTLTGSQIPSQFKIQIMTVTGKVVREITRQELGPIHIGRNITEYKWDGKDQYGQTLGNGVYLYRVVTAINGQGIEHREDMDLDDRPGANQVDKFFKNGYGKMYIMR